METKGVAALAEAARLKYRLRQEALRRAAESGWEAPAARNSAPALEATLANISDEVTAEAQERRNREAKLR
jgi:hypothetical protein